MAKNVFSVPIFFIAFRECLEASLIVAILLGLVEQIVIKKATVSPHDQLHGSNATPDATLTESGNEKETYSTTNGAGSGTPTNEDTPLTQRALIRKLRIQIFAGAAVGLLIAIAIGAAFIAVWFTKANDFWSKSEDLWEGIFSLIASLIIFMMGITMLKLDQAKAKWRVKLTHAFQKRQHQHLERGARTGRFVLFFLPLITVLREGLEAVVFIGGVALGQPASAIPLAAIIGLICGLICGWIIYQFASRTTLRIFLIAMTNLLLLIGAGLFSKAVGDFESNAFNHLLGADADDAGGDGPGSFPVNNNVWHLDCCNPENPFDGQGWSIFSAIFGWTNSATIGTVLSYVFYWVLVVITLIFMKWNEGRTKVMGKESKTGTALREKREANATAVAA